MSTKNSMLNAKAEVVLMGIAQPVNDKEELVYIIDYIAKVLNRSFTGEQVYAKATSIGRDHHIRYISVDKYDGMLMISLPMTTSEDEHPESFDLFSDDGVYSYVYNDDYPDCSEYGYSYYVRYHNFAKRCF